jgi:holo-[acyl-carrier protein] synthase
VHRRGLRIGLDHVALAEVQDAWTRFGERYLRRIFTEDEAAYALSAPACLVQRLAARFAAKEAVIKALNLGNAGVSWRHMGIRRMADGAPELVLQGLAQQALEALGPTEVAVSLSHDTTHAHAMVAILPASAQCRTAGGSVAGSAARP